MDDRVEGRLGANEGDLILGFYQMLITARKEFLGPRNSKHGVDSKLDLVLTRQKPLRTWDR